MTADVKAGTGGIDASIGFETFRPENVGVAFNDSMGFFSIFMNAKTSVADLIALGTAMSIGACGGPPIPLRGGRVDAVGPGPSGVPEPETDIKTTLAEFSSAGFSQEDSIGLTACGHTMGGVHYSNFPQVVPESSVGVNNSGGRVAFDDTVANFDINVVQQYIQGNGARGGPLVTTSNKTVQSDLRLYSSDGNTTVRKLGQSMEQFQSTCTTLISRMLDTVPRGVTLRYIQVRGFQNAPTSLKVTVIDRNGHLSESSVNAITDLVDNGNGVYGPTFHYPFTVSFAGSSGLSGIEAGTQKLPLQDSLFVVPALSSVSPGLATYNILDPTHEFTFNITAAVSLILQAKLSRTTLNHTGHPVSSFRSPARLERNHLHSRTSVWDVGPTNRFLHHGGAQIDRHGWPICDVLGYTSAEHDIVAAFRR